MGVYPKHRKPAGLKKCPECGKLIKARGLHGHITLTHGIIKQPESVPDLSGLDKTNKDEFINEFVEMTAKNVLSIFVALGLKTHLEATVVNDADGNTYKLSFRNINSLYSGGVSENERPDQGFLHCHPGREAILELSPDHVIVDRKDWEKARVQPHPTPEISEGEIVELWKKYSSANPNGIMLFSGFESAIKELKTY